MAKLISTEARERRHLRVRKKVRGTSSRPRLCVFRSLKHIYAQIVDDSRGCTLTAASSQEPQFREVGKERKKTEGASLVGAAIGQRAVAQGIEQVVFDRGGYKYQGRVKALAEASRKEGLRF